MMDFDFWTIFWSLVALIHIGLALPPAIRERSWKRFFIAVVLSFVFVVLPLFIFSASALIPCPDWKGGCHHGWLDCFLMGKLALLPLVLWASASLYAIDILRTPNRTRPWIVLGVLTGAITSTGCLGMGLIICEKSLPVYTWLAVPFYVAVWYTMRARQLLKAAGTNLGMIVATLLGNTPFWIVAMLWSRKAFAALPNEPPCFIATAAIRGHAAVVGPRVRVAHRGAEREATQQLLTLWRLEENWTCRAPRSHAGFRRIYNVIGPRVAARITTPFRADLAHLAIKPVELFARAILKKE
ncbi:MAG: hypothetical protein NTY53_18180 [Kiritimatiellaeota bacterium]|nr:hypothetical protein [Kiritimatiellota bacterium]